MSVLRKLCELTSGAFRSSWTLHRCSRVYDVRVLSVRSVDCAYPAGMSSISSRTAYVVLASIEDELRSIIDQYAGEDDPLSLLGSTLLQTVLDRRRRERLSTGPNNVGQVLPYLDFQDSYELANKLTAVCPRNLPTAFGQSVPN